MADEGMWMPSQLKQLRKELKAAGLRMPVSQLYRPGGKGLTDAIVSFGGFCSGVVVSSEGLVLTNHHCGFNCVQQHSSLQHNYLQDGFVAKERAEELPNPELYVRFLLRQEDVTRRVLAALTPDMSEQQRSYAVDSVTTLISDEATRRDTTLVAVVSQLTAGTTLNVFGLELQNESLAVGTLVIIFPLGFLVFCKADKLNKARQIAKQ